MSEVEKQLWNLAEATIWIATNDFEKVIKSKETLFPSADFKRVVA